MTTQKHDYLQDLMRIIAYVEFKGKLDINTYKELHNITKRVTIKNLKYDDFLGLKYKVKRMSSEEFNNDVGEYNYWVFKNKIHNLTWFDLSASIKKFNNKYSEELEETIDEKEATEKEIDKSLAKPEHHGVADIIFSFLRILSS